MNYVHLNFVGKELRFVEDRFEATGFCFYGYAILLYGDNEGRRKSDTIELLPSDNLREAMRSWYTIAKNPELFSKILDEIDRFLKNKEEEVEEFIQLMKYVVNMLKLWLGL